MPFTLLDVAYFCILINSLELCFVIYFVTWEVDPLGLGFTFC